MKFIDKAVRKLNPRQPDQMVRLIELMCGWDLKPTTSDIRLLADVLKSTGRVNYEQFNEILLLLNQQTVTRHFFDFFFGDERRFIRPCVECSSQASRKKHPRAPVSLQKLREGVEKLRGFAMLCYGNFRYAFRQLSSMPREEFIPTIKRLCLLGKIAVGEDFLTRPRKITRINPISKNRTWYVGHLSARKRETDFMTWLAIVYKLRYITKRRISTWKQDQSWKEQSHKYEASERSQIQKKVGKAIFRSLKASILNQARKYVEEVINRADRPRLNAARWAPRLGSVLEVLESSHADLEEARAQGIRNTDTYLTWDYMDVYVATSMRERWEYEAAHSFIQAVFKGNARLRRLKVRYFDPTQSYSANRIDKGLVEALMLKRAKCTLYLAQETDTLGKDSELASTLAQGKPVIAYVPEIRDPRTYAQEISNKPLDFVVKRWLQLEAEDIFTLPECLKELEGEFRARHMRNPSIIKKGLLEWKDELFIALRKATSSRTFHLIGDEEREIRANLGKQFVEICEILAVAEKHYLDKRAETLREAHPLAIQVNLQDGVANGVLVARTTHQCAQLIYGLLTNSLAFHLVHNEGEGMTELKEKITHSPYRVVTDDPKLTNSFWNFYLTSERISR